VTEEARGRKALEKALAGRSFGDERESGTVRGGRGQPVAAGGRRRIRETARGIPSLYSDPDVDALIERAAEAVPPEVREDLLAAVRRRALEDLPYIPLYSPDQTYGVRTGIEFNPRLDRAIFAADLRRSSR
jgi:hypothetical protein